MNLLLILVYNEVEDEYVPSAYNEKTNLLSNLGHIAKLHKNQHEFRYQMQFHLNKNQ